MLRRRRSEADRPAPAPGSARTAALRLLNRRDYSVAEITTRLLDRGHADEEVQSVVAALRADRLLDDERVGRAHVRTASLVKGRGRHRIRRELEARGLARQAADAVVAELSRDDEQAALDRLVERATRGERLDADDERRLFQRLLRRGFDADAIRTTLKQHQRRSTS